ncbi:hypothetical protein P5G62_010060 [Neobacillus sp. 179-C4.2 HS]|uniref:DUF2726 domain-containing protein n=1 Tax=Neobacillus driksii TaxID=3035913 RepID=A0ABV4YRT3_9BACI|nr:hypothetical protein [Neobacillus sp. 179.-C4.2 HS]MDP5195024.1 hypothetical protein [Neobacillus sp. 179.-C4.2 HS]
MPNKKTHEEFLAEVFALVGNEYTIIGQYVNSGTELEIKHNICNKIYPVIPKRFLKGNHRCLDCRDRIKHENFVAKVFDLVGEEYSVMSEFKGAREYVIMKHNKCNEEYPVTPDNFIRGKRCGYCSGNRKKTTEIFKKQVYELVGNEYIVIGEYINADTPLTMLHTKCNREYPVIPDNFLSGKRCRLCSGNVKKTTQIFKKEVYELVEDEYTVIGEYENAKIPIMFKHNICNEEFLMSPDNFIHGTRCSICTTSKGETTIAKWLDKSNIKYEREYKFNDCKNTNPLPFDFAINKEDDSILLIEYHGQQHYKAIEIFGGEKRFNYTQKNDKIKKIYCEKNNIPLIVIPYWNFDKIDEILTKELL